jgi:hypothetical protein
MTASGHGSVLLAGGVQGSQVVTGSRNNITFQGPSANVLRQLVEEFRSRSALDPRDRRDRTRMLQRVRRAWIDGYLNNSLHGAALQALGLEERSDAVPDRWRMVLQEGDRPGRTLAPDCNIIQAYDELDGELLILGEPGSGKTTVLLELTRELLARAERDEASPMPVVFNLASWALHRWPLANWLAEELRERYDIPRKIAHDWVSRERILPLLDGLDEVAADSREACVEAINAYRSGCALSLTGLVVTSRVEDYDMLSRRLQVRGAVLLRPLRVEQIDAYLASAGQQLSGVKAALDSDSVLRDELATSPLLLSTMSLAYQGVGPDSLPSTGTVDERRAQLFDAYVERMLGHRRPENRYSLEQTFRWLGWLASRMTQQAQTVFQLEHLQPEWLPDERSRVWYTLIDRLGTAMFAGILTILAVGSATMAFASQLQGRGSFVVVLGNLGFGFGGLSVGLALGLSTALVIGLLGGGNSQQPHRHSAWHVVARAVIGWLVFMSALVLYFASAGAFAYLSVARLSNVIFQTMLGWGLAADVQFGMTAGVAIALIAGINGKLGTAPRRVVLVERIRWSWSKALVSALGGLVAALAVAVFAWFANMIYVQLTSVYLEPASLGSIALPLGIIGSVLGGAVGGLTSRELETKIAPNQGIRRSARTALILGLAVGPLFGAAVGIQFVRLGLFPIFALVSGFLTACGFGLAFGGYACFSHLILRLLLWRQGALPLDVVPFLDFASDRVLLRRVGGGYIFTHRFLQQYFAIHESDAPARLSVEALHHSSLATTTPQVRRGMPHVPMWRPHGPAVLAIISTWIVVLLCSFVITNAGMDSFNPLNELWHTAEKYALQGDTSRARAMFIEARDRALSANASRVDDAICWHGSIDGFADVVLPVCESEVQIATSQKKSVDVLASYRDSRGLARALTGDTPGAIADFRYYVTVGASRRTQQRQAWIGALARGANPFDAATLDALRNE